MEKLRIKHINLIKNTSLKFQRYLLEILPWKERLIGIKGSRGVGKTTLLLQYIKKEYKITSSKVLYISLDDLYFSDHTLVEFTETFVQNGGEHLFIDEVHKYKNWSIELKNVYDSYPTLKVVFTGSSLLEILNSRSDLSRRALVYSMQGLSFREFLNFKYSTSFEVVDFNEILKNHTDVAITITKQIKPIKELNVYYKTGYFPFYSDNDVLYFKRLQEIINMIVEVELPMLRNTDVNIVSKIKQLIYIISQSAPFKPNISALANKIKTTRKTLLEYLLYLTDAGVFRMLHKDSFGVSLLQKPEKIFLENTNYIFAIKNSVENKGNIRETFFLNQLTEKHQVTYPEKGDFFVNNKFLFEIGGENKSRKQIYTQENSFIVSDNIEIGYKDKIPLWLFGFLY